MLGSVCSRIREKDSFLDEQTTYGNSVGAVDLQEINRYASGGGLGEKASAIPSEMLFPLLSSWMKQWDNLRGAWVNPRQVRPLIAVAVATRESQIFQRGQATVLLGDDVVEVKRQLSVSFREAAILAAMTGPGTYGFVNRFVHKKA